MTRTLYLLRHAKSGWDNPNMADFDRPLSKRGEREVSDLADLFVALGYAPEVILCSTARRTRETLAGILGALAGETQLMLTRAIYEAPAERLLDLVRGLPNDAQSALVIGHNPGLEGLARTLPGSGESAPLSVLASKYPPAGLAEISFDSDWAALDAGTGRLEAFHTPPTE